jgi:hypothetical protein
VVDVAADADPQVRALADDIDRQRTVGMTAIASVIAKCGALRADLSVERAADVLVSVASPATYRWMVPRRGWAPDEFGRWLGDTLVNLLVAPGWKPSPSGSSVARPTSRRSRSSG